MSEGSRMEQLAGLRAELATILERMDAFQEEYAAQVAAAQPRQRRGASNLIDYLAFRGTDGTGLEADLAELGLATLSRVGPHARESIEALAAAARALDGEGVELPPRRPRIRSSSARLRRQTRRLFGPKEEGASVRVMVTMPTEAADGPELVHEMVRSGMNVARINCAHDGPDVWLRMIRNVRAAAQSEGRPMRVFMDLAGPKIRIGPMPSGPRVRKLGPKLDDRGRPKHGGRVSIGADGADEGTTSSAGAHRGGRDRERHGAGHVRGHRLRRNRARRHTTGLRRERGRDR
jgi:pyruvate kinase